MQIYKFRDLTIISEDDRDTVIACDSCCGIGENELDLIKIDNRTVGYFSARVCLFEMLSFNAKPEVIVNNLGIAMEGKGERIIEGINKAIEEYNDSNFFEEEFSLEKSITGSTEDNIETLQTFLGLTIIGYKKKKVKRYFKKGDLLVLLGIPKVGGEVLAEIKSKTREIVGFRELKYLSECEFVKDILPIGSKGAIHEIKELEKSNSIKFDIDCKAKNLEKSAGPATALLFICDKEHLKDINNEIDIPITKIGRVI